MLSASPHPVVSAHVVVGFCGDPFLCPHVLVGDRSMVGHVGPLAAFLGPHPLNAPVGVKLLVRGLRLPNRCRMLGMVPRLEEALGVAGFAHYGLVARIRAIAQR